MRTPGYAWRRRGLLAGLLVAGLVLVGRASQLQLLEAERWAARAEAQQRRRLTLPAPRGTIYDRNGVPLAATREVFRVAVAPRELKDGAAAAARLRAVLGLTAAEARRATDQRRRWVLLSESYDAEIREHLGGMRGVYFERAFERFHPRAGLAGALLGRVSERGRARSGLELELDTVLSGTPGLAVVRRNAQGEPIPGAMLVVREAVAGSDVYLTIDIGLQEIVEEALERAVAGTGAAGGDVIIADPGTGELLAAASIRAHGSDHWRAATDPYEPGSILKPFLVAALLAEQRASLDDSVYAEQGRYVHRGRTIRDVHAYGWLTLEEALRFSSNIAMAKMAHRLDPRVQYRYLRDFGFGTLTGVPYPSESAGVLRRPEAWSAYSQASLAFGYEIAVTPLQMAMAYGALANGGVLMEPLLLRRVVRRDGAVRTVFSPEPVRRVVPEATAHAIGSVLADVVEEGTGQRAALGTFKVAGKTGTTERFDGVDYHGGGYMASFAGFFPASDPQLVFVVRLDRPRQPYYGGLAAAPVTRATLEAALAARSTPLDRWAVLSSSRAVGGEVLAVPDGSTPRAESRRSIRLMVDTATSPWPVQAAAGGCSPDASERAPMSAGIGRCGSSSAGIAFSAQPIQGDPERSAPPAAPFIFALNAVPAGAYARAAHAGVRAIPDVRDLPLRDAVRRLHAAGFRVQVEGAGPVLASTPAAGVSAGPGTVVHLYGSAAPPRVERAEVR